MKSNELKDMTTSERNVKFTELKKELMKLNAQIAVGTVPKSPGMVKQIKKNIARIMTFNNQPNNKNIKSTKKEVTEKA